MKIGLSIHGTSKRGITPTTRKRHGRHPFSSLLTATLSRRFHKFVCPKSLKRREGKRRDFSSLLSISTLITPLHLPHMEKATGCANCLGTALECCRRQTCNPMASATTGKSELLFALYLCPVCVSTAVLCQALSVLWGLDVTLRDGRKHEQGTGQAHTSLQEFPAHAGTSPAGPSQWKSPRRVKPLKASPTGNRRCARPRWRSCGGAAQQQCCLHIPGISRLPHLHAAIRGQTATGLHQRKQRLVQPS